MEFVCTDRQLFLVNENLSRKTCSRVLGLKRVNVIVHNAGPLYVPIDSVHGLLEQNLVEETTK